MSGKLTILDIKSKCLQNSGKLANVHVERNALLAVVGDLLRFPPELSELVEILRHINADLWKIENGKRDHERRQCFDANFIELARQVYIKNDQRAVIKQQINNLLGSTITEQKSYAVD